MTEVNRPLSLQLTSSVPKTSSLPIHRSKSTATTPTLNQTNLAKSAASSSNSTSSRSSSSSSSSITSGYESPHSPSLILPYLYVGDQTQTQIDTISNLNISYVLSLQSLPKFLDTGLETKLEAQVETPDCEQREEQNSKDEEQERQQQQQNDDDDQKNQQISQDNNKCTARVNKNNSIAKELLPSINSSKDYLVKFQSCVNRLIRGKCINISDTFEQLVDKFFDETHNFIEEARRNKCNILVHCKAGISRSPTIAIAYLMKWKRLHLNEAYQFVKQCRPQISPNLNFMGQLLNYEKQLIQKGVHRPKCASPSPMLPSPTLCCLSDPYLGDDHNSRNQLDRPTYEKLPTLNVIQTK